MEDQTLEQVDLQPSRRASPPDAQGWNLPGYELLECLGQGTFGQVWSGIQRSTSQKVAIKVLHFTTCA